MTSKEQKIFSSILDLNHEAINEAKPSKKLELLIQLNEKKRQLKESMGDNEYDKFMNMGSIMFAPKDDDDE